MPVSVSTLFNRPMILRPLTEEEQDLWPHRPPTYALCLHDPHKTYSLAELMQNKDQEPGEPIAFLHDDVLFDPDHNFFTE